MYTWQYLFNSISNYLIMYYKRHSPSTLDLTGTRWWGTYIVIDLTIPGRRLTSVGRDDGPAVELHKQTTEVQQSTSRLCNCSVNRKHAINTHSCCSFEKPYYFCTRNIIGLLYGRRHEKWLERDLSVKVVVLMIEDTVLSSVYGAHILS